VTQSAFGPDTPIHPRNLKRSGQTQFLGLDAARDNGAIFGPAFIGLGRLMLRGERSPVREFERF
jgi:hypothetical protein